MRRYIDYTHNVLAGVRFPGLTHPGIIGTAPSKELLRIWNERERQLEESGLSSLTLCEVVHQRPLANLPIAKGCLLGNVSCILFFEYQEVSAELETTSCNISFVRMVMRKFFQVSKMVLTFELM